MLLTVLDGSAISQKIIVQGQEAQLDHSGVIAATSVSQIMLTANALRSGWMVQNRGANPMYVNELGTAAVGVSANVGSFVVAPGGSFPPFGFPMSTGVINIVGTLNDGFVVREW